MNKKYQVSYSNTFEKNVKRLFKKHKSLKSDLRNFINNLEENLKNSVEIKSNIFKLRLAIKSKSQGKSGGARIIMYKITEDFKIYLLHIYDKSEKKNVNITFIKDLIKNEI
ncbi:MAG: hypothetical protein B6I24_00030 [Bacteroidetes bacterium 4572_128]|nr:MAG: hypothetical protein B6I24_00030 [Bacteroidetes bacterium 4572_128]